MTDFGAYIKEVREKKKLTLNQVATYSQISSAQLSRIENGKRGTPKPDTIKKLAVALKEDYNELMSVAGYIETDDADDEKDFESFINDPELKRWHKELPKSPEEDLRKLRKMWEIIKSEKD